MRILTGTALLAASMCWTNAGYADKLNKGAEAEIQKLIDVVAPAGDRVGPIHYGELAVGGVETIVFEGDQLSEYYFNAICDDDCTNLNLAVRDTTGEELDVDDADDAAPVIQVFANRSAPGAQEDEANPRPLTVEVRMVRCKTATCAYGVATTRTE